MKKRFEYRHTVSFEDTNVMGNVYFSNYISWQGKCRELFIKEKAVGLLREIESGDLALITLHCSCNYLSELKVFDEVIIGMGLESIQHNRIKMSFEYYKTENGNSNIVAAGVHETGCFRRSAAGLEAIPVPLALVKALEGYSSGYYE